VPILLQKSGIALYLVFRRRSEGATPWIARHFPRSPPRPLGRKPGWPKTRGIRATSQGSQSPTRSTVDGATEPRCFKVEAIEAFLTRKWNKELDYRLIKEVWAFRDNRIAVRFAYEWHDDSGNWFRSYGNENWEFDAHGLMRLRIASINDLPIKESERKYHWPLGRRPDGHPGLSDLGL
jgi:nuclear transport factor 2 (NTF2) superfamily protein